MGLKGEALVEDGAEVEKFGDLGDGEGRGVRREVTGEDPRVCCTGAALGGGFVEDDDFGERRLSDGYGHRRSGKNGGDPSWKIVCGR
jgi:hypothetical protein